MREVCRYLSHEAMHGMQHGAIEGVCVFSCVHVCVCGVEIAGVDGETTLQSKERGMRPFGCCSCCGLDGGVAWAVEASGEGT